MPPTPNTVIPEQPKSFDLVKNSGIFYAAMSAIGLGLMYFYHRTLPAAVALPASTNEGMRWLTVGIVAAGLLLILSYFFEDWFPSFRDLKSAIVELIGPLPIPAGIYLAIISSISEEILFRGAIQPFAGLWFTALLFGLLHMGPAPLSSWSLWAMLAGLLLGWIFDATSSLWPAILAHFLVNLVSILNLRQAWRKAQQTPNMQSGHSSQAQPTARSDD